MKLTLTLILALIVLLGACNMPEDPLPQKKEAYTFRVGNNIGHEIYDCHTYRRFNDTYQLFDKNDKLIIEVTITNGYYVEITPNN